MGDISTVDSNQTRDQHARDLARIKEYYKNEREDLAKVVAPNTTPPTLPDSYEAILYNRIDTKALVKFLDPRYAKPAFLYGSLMLPRIIVDALNLDVEADGQSLKSEGDIAAAVAEIGSRMMPALLTGVERLWIRDSPFPALVRCRRDNLANSKVEGIAIFGMTHEEQGIMDQYECMYNAEDVELVITLQDGKPQRIDATTYVWKGSDEDLWPSAEREWDLVKYINERKL